MAKGTTVTFIHKRYTLMIIADPKTKGNEAGCNLIDNILHLKVGWLEK
ncbi:MAG: hypothetical protein ABJB76_05810 [Candidatus Nitrosocosmicus sp.]